MEETSGSKLRAALRFYWAALRRAPVASWRAFWGAEAMRGVLGFALRVALPLLGVSGIGLLTFENATAGGWVLALVVVLGLLVGIYDARCEDVEKARRDGVKATEDAKAVSEAALTKSRSALAEETSRADRERALRIKTGARNAKLRALCSEKERITRARRLFAGAAGALEDALRNAQDDTKSSSWGIRWFWLLAEAFNDQATPASVLAKWRKAKCDDAKTTRKRLILVAHEAATLVTPETLSDDFDPHSGEWDSWVPSRKDPQRIPQELQEKLDEFTNGVATAFEKLSDEQLSADPEARLNLLRSELDSLIRQAHDRRYSPGNTQEGLARWSSRAKDVLTRRCLPKVASDLCRDFGQITAPVFMSMRRHNEDPTAISAMSSDAYAKGGGWLEDVRQKSSRDWL